MAEDMDLDNDEMMIEFLPEEQYDSDINNYLQEDVNMV